MNNDTNKVLLLILIFIGIILIVLVAGGRRSPMMMRTYQGYGLTASTTPITEPTTGAVGTYTFTRYIPDRRTVPTTSTTSTYYYTTPSVIDPSAMFPDGCTMTSPYSLTTGLPCS